MRILHIVPVLILVASGSIAFAGQSDETKPAVLDLIDDPERISTLTISADGTRAATATLVPGKKPRTSVALYSTSAPSPRRFEIAGVVRDLLYMPEGESVLGIQYRKAKRREGDAQLLRFEPDQPKPRRLVRLPATARDLDFWWERDVLLISCSNEVRSLLMPHLLSGPLYTIPGENLAVASIPGSSMIVLGREDGLILVDLEDPHGLEEMPVRESVALNQPAIALSASPDGSYVMARLADDSVYEWRIDSLPTPPPPVEPESEVVQAEEPEVPIEPPAAEPEPEVVPEEAPSPPLEPEPEVVPAEEPEVPIEPLAAEPEPEVAPEEAPSPPLEPEPEVIPAEEPPPPASKEPLPQLRGKIDGPAAGEVVAVVLLGPNNILREAQRTKPDSDGTWRASGLTPGRYRIQLDGGGDRFLVTDPPFLMVEIDEDGTVEAGVIQVIRAM
jgi:hypothetical protein